MFVDTVLSGLCMKREYSDFLEANINKTDLLKNRFIKQNLCTNSFFHSD